MKPLTKTRADLTYAVYRNVGLSRKDCANMVDDVIGEMADALARGESVKIAGFGIFEIRQKNEREGRNPKTGVAASISPRRVVAFRPSTILKRRVNSES